MEYIRTNVFKHILTNVTNSFDKNTKLTYFYIMKTLNSRIICKFLYFQYILSCVGVGGFSTVVATFNHVGGSFNLLWPPPGMS